MSEDLDEEEDEDEDEEEDDGEILLEMDKDGGFREYKPNPCVWFDFDTEDELFEFMTALTKSGIATEGNKCLVKNVSADFFNRFEPIETKELK
jgi:hypothetical protein